MYLHKNGKVAEYQEGINGFFWLVGNSSGFPIHLSKEEIYQSAIDYHEEEGCKAYLELYPAPEKGNWAFIAQDADGDWCGYDLKPLMRKDQWEASAAKSNGWDRISQSPPNPFWRKTLR